jgi:hypothetical protein
LAPVFDGVRVFTATKHFDRQELGDRMSDWIAMSGVEVVDVIVRQTSDESFHCLSIVVFYRRPAKKKPDEA